MLTMIDKITTPDRYTVEFALNTPYFEFPRVLGTIQAKVAPKEAFDTLAEKPVGTGPLKLAQFVPGESAVALSCGRGPLFRDRSLRCRR